MAMWAPSTCCWAWLREEEGIAHRVLEENGLTDEMVCDILHRSVGPASPAPAPSQGLTPRAQERRGVGRFRGRPHRAATSAPSIC